MILIIEIQKQAHILTSATTAKLKLIYSKLCNINLKKDESIFHKHRIKLTQ